VFRERPRGGIVGDMLLISLNSGSNGNSIYVESGGVRLLFDAGLSASQAQERLASHGRDASKVDALFVSHDHSDHVRGVGVYTRKFGMPLYVTPRTLAVSKRRMQLGNVEDVQHFRAGDAVRIKHVTVETIGTPHDAVDGSVFVVDDGTHRLGICTDLGHVYDDLEDLVRRVDGLFIESNYDVQMLLGGDYPPALKRRIHGPGGHISNRDAADCIARNASSRLQWVCLAHLSAENNTPALALGTAREALGAHLPIHVASRHGVSQAFTLGPPQGSYGPRRGLALEIDHEGPASTVRPRAGATVADALFAPLGSEAPRRPTVADDIFAPLDRRIGR
jgi:phosphoribosyl 1,2-cyclic phosphodiesterase